MKPQNLLFILSDEHNKKALGSYGHPIVKTPNLDKLAARGTRFTSAYTNCPICVPARAALATGRYVHQTRCWDNAIAYEGQPPSWGHRLMAQGHHAVSIGKLHYTRTDPLTNGFDEEILPLHIVNGTGDLLGLIRQELPVRKGAALLGPEAGPGESEYAGYDRSIRDATVQWLKEQAHQQGDKPWALYVGFVSPHFPLITPQKFFDMYPAADMPMPSQYAQGERPTHPFIQSMRASQIYDQGFTGPDMVKRAIAAYFGLVSFMDDNVGQILDALKEAGLEDSTRVVYSSDHGDNLGTRGLWGKSTMYEESAGIPLIMAGEGVPAGAVCDVPVSLVDVFPTIVQGTGAKANPADADLPGQSLFDIAAGHARPRTILSEYHAAAAITGSFMIRHGRFKYVYYVGLPPMLFDLEADPEERHDLGCDPAHAATVRECEAALRSVVDPEAANARCLADQAARIEAVGGREAILKAGTFRYSPPPKHTAVMYS
jgi:choline-sulfatase